MPPTVRIEAQPGRARSLAGLRPGDRANLKTAAELPIAIRSPRVLFLCPGGAFCVPDSHHTTHGHPPPVFRPSRRPTHPTPRARGARCPPPTHLVKPKIEVALFATRLFASACLASPPLRQGSDVLRQELFRRLPPLRVQTLRMQMLRATGSTRWRASLRDSAGDEQRFGM